MTAHFHGRRYRRYVTAGVLPPLARGACVGVLRRHVAHEGIRIKGLSPPGGSFLHQAAYPPDIGRQNAQNPVVAFRGLRRSPPCPIFLGLPLFYCISVCAFRPQLIIKEGDEVADVTVFAQTKTELESELQKYIALVKPQTFLSL